VLFPPEPAFEGLPADVFEIFGVRDRDLRRRHIVERIHPPLEQLSRDLLALLAPHATRPLHAHLPRLDWPRGYQPFCTWLALSAARSGYLAGPQLNVGVHRDHVAVRLGWDTQADAFGRFEFLARHGTLRDDLRHAARAEGLRFRVYAAAPWPVGSELVLSTEDDLDAAFREARGRGVWWELGRRYDVPAELPLVASAELGREARRIFGALLPLEERIAVASLGG
jgi:hypothetical protein